MWKTISSKILIDHPRIKLIEDHVMLPSGEKIDYLKFEDSGTSATAVCIENNKILVQKEYSYPPNKQLYQFPGGYISPNEELEKGINRELMEESGVKANKLKNIGAFYTNNRRSNFQMHVYIATELILEKLPSDSTEQISNFWLEESAIDEMIKNNEIENSTFLATWSLYKLKK